MPPDESTVDARSVELRPGAAAGAEFCCRPEQSSARGSRAPGIAAPAAVSSAVAAPASQ